MIIYNNNLQYKFTIMIYNNNLKNGRWCRGSRSKSAVAPHATPVPHPFLVSTFSLFSDENFVHPVLVRTFFHPFLVRILFTLFWWENLYTLFSGENFFSSPFHLWEHLSFQPLSFSGENFSFMMSMVMIHQPVNYSYVAKLNVWVWNVWQK